MRTAHALLACAALFSASAVFGGAALAQTSPTNPQPGTPIYPGPAPGLPGAPPGTNPGTPAPPPVPNPPMPAPPPTPPGGGGGITPGTNPGSNPGAGNPGVGGGISPGMNPGAGRGPI